MMGFLPERVTPKIILDKPPRIFMTRMVYNKMWAWVSLCPDEISWMGTVEEWGLDYLISEVFLVDQKVTSASTEMSVDGIAKLVQELLKDGDPEGKVNRLLFWGHSHVNMGVFASKQDDDTVEEVRPRDARFFLRGIFNKEGKARFWLYNFENGFTVEDAEWDVYDPADNLDIDEIKKEIGQKVVKETYHSYVSKGSQYDSLFLVRKPEELTAARRAFILYGDDEDRRLYPEEVGLPVSEHPPKGNREGSKEGKPVVYTYTVPKCGGKSEK